MVSVAPWRPNKISTIFESTFAACPREGQDKRRVGPIGPGSSLRAKFGLMRKWFIACALVLGISLPLSGQAEAVPSLSSRLLTVYQLPLGWIVNSAPPKTERWQGFGSGFLNSLITVGSGGMTQAVSVVFDNRGNSPELTERLALNRTAATYVKALTRYLAAHPTIKGDGSFSLMSFPRVAQSSYAYEVKASEPAVGGGTVTVGGYFLLARQGNIIVALVETGEIHTPQIAQFLVFARRAVAKV